MVSPDSSISPPFIFQHHDPGSFQTRFQLGTLRNSCFVIAGDIIAGSDFHSFLRKCQCNLNVGITGSQSDPR